MSTVWQDALLVLAGVAAGFVNAVAGGASLISFPVLVAFGLPPTIANATNNVATTVQSLSAWVGYTRRGFHATPVLLALLPSVLLGAWLGASLVVDLDQGAFSRIVGGLMLVALGLIWLAPRGASDEPSPQRAARSQRVPGTPLQWALGVLWFVALGVYGGFFGGGLGLVVLPSLALVFGLDLVRANSVKSGLGLAMNATAFVVFWRAGLVEWRPAAILTVGMVAGSQLGVRWAVRVSPRALRLALTAITVVAAAHFLTR